ncbi:hypothetical protein BKA61DRAFT_672209 [Leptodontidium sp. MPI-SDFR-AT-0119]|nr:hypothetical protein BKA61DRAFT_672209 [Leptodontidium sp. MPI-SDFR-AT-0119]
MDENTRNDTLIEVVQDPFIVDLLKELPFFPLTPRAKEEYPSLPEADFALEIYAQKYKEEGILFLGDDGERKMWGPDCNYYHKKDYKGSYYKVYSPRGAKNRTFYLYQHKQSLSQIDQPKPAVDRRAMAHCSEKGWRLARSNDRHILKFPQEILDLIIRFSVCVERSVSLCPMTVTCNWRRLWSQHHYKLVHSKMSGGWSRSLRTKRYEQLEVQSIIQVQHRDREGSYTEIRNATRIAIDASCLRTCKAFEEVGSKLLYGDNEFYFSMTCTDWEGCPPSVLHPKDSEQWRPNPHQPQVDGAWLSKVNSAIGQVKHQVVLKLLPGWVAYDDFLRFLWTIGPEKAALLKSLKFRGLVKIHSCGGAYCANCRETGLLDSLRLYIHFLLKLCPRVETLTIYPSEDTRFERNPQMLPAGHPTTRDEALIQLLENEIRQIPGLKELNVLKEIYNSDDGQYSEEPLECAEATRAWLKERHIRNVRQYCEEAMAKHISEIESRTGPYTARAADRLTSVGEESMGLEHGY